jgi:hypothetical protein
VDTLLHKFRGKIKGVLEGFDRIVFKGVLRPLCFAAGMQIFLRQINVLNKDYKDWVQNASTAIVREAEEYTMTQSSSKILYLDSYKIRKEAAAHEQQAKTGIESGLIGTWSCVESCRTFKAAFDTTAGFPQIKPNNSKCKHLYFYYDHAEYGFMSIRLQTWAPYEIQIAMNGREWLKRQLDSQGVGYVLSGNKFLDVEDYETAQQLLYSQLDTQWVDILSDFLPNVFPSMKSLLGDQISYTWTLWQSEWAKDYIFKDPKELGQQMEYLLRHA